MVFGEFSEPWGLCCVVVLAECFELLGRLSVFLGSGAGFVDAFFELGPELMDFLLVCSCFLFAAHGSFLRDGVSPSGMTRVIPYPDS